MDGEFNHLGEVSLILITRSHSQKDYVCFDFVPRHHNIIRYRKGQAMITDHFSTVCAWTMFEDDVEWKYSMMISKIS